MYISFHFYLTRKRFIETEFHSTTSSTIKKTSFYFDEKEVGVGVKLK